MNESTLSSEAIKIKKARLTRRAFAGGTHPPRLISSQKGKVIDIWI
jgi:hypothetical protein